MVKHLTLEEVTLKERMIKELELIQKREDFLKREIRKLIYKIER